MAKWSSNGTEWVIAWGKVGHRNGAKWFITYIWVKGKEAQRLALWTANREVSGSCLTVDTNDLLGRASLWLC